MSKERKDYEYNNEIADLKAKNEVLRDAFNEMSKEVKRLTDSLYNAKFGAHRTQQRAADYKAALMFYASFKGDEGHEARVALGQTCATCEVARAWPQVVCARRVEMRRRNSCKHWKFFEGVPGDEVES